MEFMKSRVGLDLGDFIICQRRKSLLGSNVVGVVAIVDLDVSILDFPDQVVNRIWEIEDGNIKVYYESMSK